MRLFKLAGLILFSFTVNSTLQISDNFFSSGCLSIFFISLVCFYILYSATLLIPSHEFQTTWWELYVFSIYDVDFTQFHQAWFAEILHKFKAEDLKHTLLD